MKSFTFLAVITTLIAAPNTFADMIFHQFFRLGQAQVVGESEPCAPLGNYAVDVNVGKIGDPQLFGVSRKISLCGIELEFVVDGLGLWTAMSLQEQNRSTIIQPVPQYGIGYAVTLENAEGHAVRVELEPYQALQPIAVRIEEADRDEASSPESTEPSEPATPATPVDAPVPAPAAN